MGPKREQINDSVDRKEKDSIIFIRMAEVRSVAEYKSFHEASGQIQGPRLYSGDSRILTVRFFRV